MSVKDCGSSVCPGTVISLFCLLVCFAGFMRMEVKLNDYQGRLIVVEETVARVGREMAPSTNEGSSIKLASVDEKPRRSERSISGASLPNDTTNIKQLLEDLLTTSLKICHQKGNTKVCSPGRSGPPGKTGPKGDRGDSGRRRRRGAQGTMGQPGRSSKQGIVGPPGLKGEKGIKGEPGEPISLPVVTISSRELTVTKSQTASLLCSASGNPAAQISWTKMSGSLLSNRIKVTSDGLMQISDVRLEDAGRYKCMAQNILGKDEKVTNLVVQSCKAVGVADRNKIPDFKMTASTIYGKYNWPHFGRLHYESESTAGGWCPETSWNRNDFLQVDMGVVHSVCGVATQGYSTLWITSYKLQLSTDGVNWNTYKEHSVDKVFTGNTDDTGVVQNSLSSVARARFVRFYAVTFNSWPCLRVDIFVLQ